MIAFSPSGVRTPSRAQAASNRGPATKEEPFWEEAAQFTRRHCLQRDVEIEVRLVPHRHRAQENARP